MAVLVLLLIASLYSWSVILGKMSTFRKATRESQRFIPPSARRLACKRWRRWPRSARQARWRRFRGGLRDLQAADGRLGTAAQSGAAGAVGADGGERGHKPAWSRRLTWLATIASASPVRGLFGTVIGRLWTPFTDWAQRERPRCGRWRRAISEALITTAAGLFVAIPAVIAYNQFTARIRVFAAAIDDFCRELVEFTGRDSGARGESGEAWGTR